MPETTDGQIDYRQLEALTKEQGVTTGALDMPETPTEKTLVRIWQDLLGKLRIGANDNFFELGGHSLKATIMASHINKELDVHITLGEIFQFPTVKDMAAYIDSIGGAAETKYEAIPPVGDLDFYELSSAQKRLYLVNRLVPHSTAYNIIEARLLEGTLDREKLTHAFRQLIARHEGFRTSFAMEGDIPVQRIVEHVDFTVEFFHLTRRAAGAELKELIDTFERPFDLSVAPLMRVRLIKTALDKHILLTDLHHIITDGLSQGIFFHELKAFYAGVELPELTVRYVDFARWQNNRLKSAKLKEQEDFWLRQFEGEIPVLELPVDFPRPSVQEHEGRELIFTLQRAETAALKQLASDMDATLFMVVLAIYNLFLAKLSGQEDIVIGTGIAGRRHADLESVFGMFVNTLVLRNFPSSSKSFKTFLMEIKTRTLEVFENQDYQFEDLVEKLNIKRDMSRNPLFDTMIAFQNLDVLSQSMPEIKTPGLEIKPYNYEIGISMFDLTLAVIEDVEQEALDMHLEYSTRLFKLETINRFAGYFRRIVSFVLDNPEAILADVEIVSPEEKKKILYEFNDTQAPYPSERTLHRLFEKQVEKTPDHVAVVKNNKYYMTYRELNAKADALASLLAEKGVVPDTIVGIMMERSIWMVIGLLGILKAGGAYMPIDPEFPPERINYMLADSSAGILLSTGDLMVEAGKVDCRGKGSIEIICIDTLKDEFFKRPSQISTPANLAYVIYTSGTTGQPKGVLVEHGNIVNIVHWFARRYDIKTGTNVIQLSKYTFDASMNQIFGTLLYGGSLYLITEDLLMDLDGLRRYIRDNDIHIINFVPLFLKELLVEGERLESLQAVISGADTLDNATKDMFLKKGYRLFNQYGPTETTIDALSSECSGGPVTLGTPVANARCYILDRNNKPVPIGVHGELYVAGDSVSRGYLNRPELTSEKFNQDYQDKNKTKVLRGPGAVFQKSPWPPEARLYRTGDLVRWLPDGTIEFLGRIDEQVKIRGFRIELGEIETQLLKHEDVKEIIVTARTGNFTAEKYLCAYIVPAVSTFNEDVLRKFLSRKLPDYMVPSYFVRLESIPLTPNGKVDRKALPEPETVGAEVVFTPPRNEIEMKLAEIWSRVLGIEKERIGIDFDFFGLGGHSLKATSLVSRIQKAFHVNVPLLMVFDNPTINEMARCISETSGSTYSAIPSAEKKEFYVLSSAQERLYVLHQMLKDVNAYNMPQMMKFQGKVDRDGLQTVFNTLVSRHESLRTSFEMIGEIPVQRIHESAAVIIQWHEPESGEHQVSRIFADFIKPFDLAEAPLLRAAVIKLAEDRHILLMDMHHIISDGTSMWILIKELMSLYEGEELPPVRIQYKDYSQWQNDWLRQDGFKEQESYWLRKYSGDVPVLELPIDFYRPAVQVFEGSTVDFLVGQEETEQLKQLASQQGATLFMVLLAAYNVFLSRLCGQEDVVVGSPVAARRHADLESVVGMFVNMLAIRNFPAPDKTFALFLSEVKETVLEDFEHQEYSFEDLVDKVNLKRDAGRNPLFDVVFSLQNVQRFDMAVEGLSITPYEYKIDMSKFDLSLFAEEKENKLQFIFEYCTRLFEKDTIERFVGFFTRVISQVTRDPQLRISDIDLISEDERNRVLNDFNDTQTFFPKDKTIHQLFEEQAEQTPNAVALIYMEQSFSYRELSRESDNLARLLTGNGIRHGSIVGLMMERSPEMICAILAILKTGSVYLPIDPGHPKHRISYMLTDSAASLLLTSRSLQKEIDFSPVVYLEDFEQSSADSQDLPQEPFSLNQAQQPDSSSPAYIIYTSGTTGKPKGVLTTHYNVVRVVRETNYIEISAGDRLLQLSNYAFDGSVFDIYGALLNGAALILLTREDVLSPVNLPVLIRKQKITVFFVTTALFNALVDIEMECLKDIRKVLFGGERVSLEHSRRALAYLGKGRVIHVYGPTETTVYATYYPIEEIAPRAATVPIGMPLANTTIYILDRKLQPVPVGVEGEIYIGGDGVALGYLNRPELTAEKFNQGFQYYQDKNKIKVLRGPGAVFQKSPWPPEARLYRTGDLGHWLPDGAIEFLGRTDHQVKIRGFRIEMGEIETQLLKHESIKEAVVIDRESSSGKYLCAYFTAEGGDSVSAPEVAQLKEYLSVELPDYMIPSYFVQMDRLPLNPSGKVDLKALPEPEYKETGEYQAPTNEVEETISRVWGDVLGMEKIGINDNFFELGGDSIKAIQVVARLRKYNLELNITDLFVNGNIRQLSRCAGKTRRMIDQGMVEGEAALTPIQVWFFGNNFSDSFHFNQSVMLYREEGFDEGLIERVMTRLLEHHDALRMVYTVTDGHVSQLNRGAGDKLFDLEILDMIGEHEISRSVETAALQIQQGMDLWKGPLVRLGLFKTVAGDHLLIAVHHLVMDGVSWRILLEDFQKAYHMVEQGKEITLPDKTDSFSDWARRLTEYARSSQLLKELAYWKEVEVASIDPLPGNPGIEVGKRKRKYLDSVDVQLDEVETKKLLTGVNRVYNTEINDILLAALGLALNEQWGLKGILVNLEGHGREPIFQDVDVSRTVGWFTSQYPVYLDMGCSGDLSYRLRFVKETLRRIPNKGIGYGILRYLTPEELKNGTVFNASPRISFNYLGEWGQEKDATSGSPRFSPLRSGKDISGENEILYALDINGMITNGCLNLSFSYNPYEYERETVDLLTTAFKTALVKIIALCTGLKERQLTPSDLGQADITIEELDGILSHIKEKIGSDAELQALYPLSPMQKGMWFHASSDESSYAYFVQSMLTLSGEIDQDLLAKSAGKLMERYDILRTIFLSRGLEKPMQVVLKSREPEIYFEDISRTSEHERMLFLEEYREKDRARGFRLDRDVLMRFALFKSGDRLYHLVWSFHHVLIDGWSLGIIFKELMQVYRQYGEGKPVSLPPVIPYVNFIDWLDAQDMENGLKYWEQYLEGYEEPAVLPFSMNHCKDGDQGYNQADYFLTLDEHLSTGLRSLAVENRVTVSSIFQAAWGLLLARYNNSEDVVYGAVVSGRPPAIDGIEEIVGLFINTIPVRVRVLKDLYFTDMVCDVHESAAASRLYEYLPLVEILSRMSLKDKLIGHIMAFENYPFKKEEKDAAGGAAFTVTNTHTFEQTNFDFNLIIGPGTSYIIKLIYNTLVFEAQSIEKIAGHLENVLRQVTGNRSLPVGSVEVVTNHEKQQVLYAFNGTGAEYPTDETVVRLFAAQVEKTPDHIALVKSNKTYMTYNELNAKAGALASLLMDKGVTPGDIVAIMGERSLEIIVGIIGILKTGAAYLPIDPDYPDERKQYIVADSGAKLLLTEGDLSGFTMLNACAATRFAVSTHSSDPAYIIYTSGTTGKPKGTMISHRSLVNLCTWHNRYYGVTDADNVTQYAGLGFDASVWEIFPALTVGASLHIVASEIRLDMKALNDYYERNHISVSFLPTPVCQQFMEQDNRSLRVLLTGGDKLQYFVKRNYRLYNNYGPTENTVVTTAVLVENISDNIPVGQPIANTSVYILDKNSRRLQPVGVPGELCIAGDGLSLGYLNNPELTAERFVDLNRTDESDRSYGSYLPEEKLYETGDLVRWLPDGNIEFLGRIDQQVKIRGFRIELGEIENRLRALRDVKDAAVIAWDGEVDGGDKYLCAYVVPRYTEAPGIDPEAIKQSLSQVLPDYMVPAYYIQMETIPITVNGKVDRKALPGVRVEAGEKCEAPRSRVEEKLAAFFSDLLKMQIQDISIDTHFFNAGGHSLKATQLTSRIHKEFAVHIPIADIFKTPTIRALARYIEAAGKAQYDSIPPVEEREYYPLSAIQKRFFIVSQMEGVGAAYNVPAVFVVEGPLDRQRLERAFQRLIERHESLRTSFEIIDDEPVQIVHKAVEFHVKYTQGKDLDLDDEDSINTLVRSIVHPFDLARAPLMRVEVIEVLEGKYILLLDIHHIVTDGTSQGIFYRDLFVLYDNKELPRLPIQYKDFTQWQSSAERIAEIKKQEEYWLSRFKEKQPYSDIFTDFPRPMAQSFEGKKICFTLPEEETEKVYRLIRETGTTLYMVLLAVYTILLSRYTGQEDITVGSPIAGREHNDLDHVIGLFINALPMRNFPKSGLTFLEFLEDVKQNTLNAYENQGYPFDSLLEKLNIKTTTARNPIFDSELVLLNMGIPQTGTEELTFTSRHYDTGITQVDIALYAVEFEGTIRFDLFYCTVLFKRETMERFVTFFNEIMEMVLENYDIPLEDIRISYELEGVASQVYNGMEDDLDF